MSNICSETIIEIEDAVNQNLHQDVGKFDGTAIDASKESVLYIEAESLKVVYLLLFIFINIKVSFHLLKVPSYPRANEPPLDFYPFALTKSKNNILYVIAESLPVPKLHFQINDKTKQATKSQDGSHINLSFVEDNLDGNTKMKEHTNDNCDSKQVGLHEEKSILSENGDATSSELFNDWSDSVANDQSQALKLSTSISASKVSLQTEKSDNSPMKSGTSNINTPIKTGRCCHT